MNVLIVDDHPLVVEYLHAAAGRVLPGADVRIAHDLEAALASMLEAPAELVLLDLGLPGCGGIDSVLRFRAAFPQARIVVISSEDGHGLIRGALAAGAAGYIPKTSGPQVMLNALRLVSEGGRYIPPEALEELVSVQPVQIPARPEPEQAQESVLTVRQREVLDRLLEGQTIGEVAKGLGIAEATAKHHALAVYAAYGVSSRADLILVATRRMSAAG